VEKRNEAETLIHNVEKSLREFKEKLSADDVAHVQGAIDAARAAMEGDDVDVDVLTSKTADLSAAALRIGEAINKVGGGGAGG
jgi:molecular chaperone DnaK